MNSGEVLTKLRTFNRTHLLALHCFWCVALLPLFGCTEGSLHNFIPLLPLVLGWIEWGYFRLVPIPYVIKETPDYINITTHHKFLSP